MWEKACTKKLKDKIDVTNPPSNRNNVWKWDPLGSKNVILNHILTSEKCDNISMKGNFPWKPFGLVNCTPKFLGQSVAIICIGQSL